MSSAPSDQNSPAAGGANDEEDLAESIRKTAQLLQSSKSSVRNSAQSSLSASAAALDAVTEANLNKATIMDTTTERMNDNQVEEESVLCDEVDVDEIDVDNVSVTDHDDKDDHSRQEQEHHFITHTTPSKDDVRSAASDDSNHDSGNGDHAPSVPEFAIRDAIEFYFSEDYAKALAQAKEQERQKQAQKAAGAVAAAAMAIAPQQPDHSGLHEEEEKTEEVHEAARPAIAAGSPEPLPVEEMNSPAINSKRGEFIRVTVYKKDASIPHGLEIIVMDEQDLRVSSMDPDGLFADTSLKLYDKLLRINKISCANLDPAGVMQILSVMTGKITILAQNIGGDRLRAEVSIRKPFVDSRVGVLFREVEKGNSPQSNDNPRKRYLEVTRVEEKSLFANTLIHPGDRVMAINDCVDLDMNTAKLLMETSPLHVHIAVRTKLDLRSVLAREQVKELPPGYDIVRATEEARRHERERQHKQGFYYIVCEQPGACGTMFQWMGNVYVVIVVIALVIVAWTGWRDQNYENSDTIASILPFVAIFVGGALLCFLVNAPWLFRQVGKRFSWAQLVCNILLACAFVAVFLLASFAVIPFVQEQELVLYIVLIPLAVFINLPSIFLRMDDGSDGDTITPSDIGNEDDLESNVSEEENNGSPPIPVATVTPVRISATRGIQDEES